MGRCSVPGYQRVDKKKNVKKAGANEMFVPAFLLLIIALCLPIVLQPTNIEKKA